MLYHSTKDESKLGPHNYLTALLFKYFEFVIKIYLRTTLMRKSSTLEKPVEAFNCSAIHDGILKLIFKSSGKTVMTEKVYEVTFRELL